MKVLSSCPVCRSSNLQQAFSAPTTRGQDKRLWSVSECKSCSHQFMNPQPSWDELAFYYDKNYQAYDPMHGSQADDDAEVEQARSRGTVRHIPIPSGKR